MRVRYAAIFSATGPAGRFVGQELSRRGIPFRVVARRADVLARTFTGTEGAEILAADLADPEQAARAGARAVLVSNVYSYGRPRMQPVPESHPREPEASKGGMRKEQEDVFLEAHRAGHVPSLVARLPDFYRPWADNSFANPTLRAALAGKAAPWLGPLDVPHEFTLVSPTPPRPSWSWPSARTPTGRRGTSRGRGRSRAGSGWSSPTARRGARPAGGSSGGRGSASSGSSSPCCGSLSSSTTCSIRRRSWTARSCARLPHWASTPYPEGIRLTLEWMRAHPLAGRG